MSPLTRRMMYPSMYPEVSHADWCWQSDNMPDSRLQDILEREEDAPPVTTPPETKEFLENMGITAEDPGVRLGQVRDFLARFQPSWLF